MITPGQPTLHSPLCPPSYPKDPTNNVAFPFTNVSSPLYLNVPTDTVPDALEVTPRFLPDEPVALQENYLTLKGVPKRKRGHNGGWPTAHSGDSDGVL